MDLRSDKCMGAIKNQKSCGSCWTFAATAVLEFNNCVKTGLLKTLRLICIFLLFLSVILKILTIIISANNKLWTAQAGTDVKVAIQLTRGITSSAPVARTQTLFIPTLELYKMIDLFKDSYLAWKKISNNSNYFQTCSMIAASFLQAK